MPDLIPLRALNQVTYCQRLYYLQYVDCVMPTNEHVEGGLHDHRRVDDRELAARWFPGVAVAADLGEFESLMSTRKARAGLGFTAQHRWRDEYRPA